MSCRKYSCQYLTDSLSDLWFCSAFPAFVLPAVGPVIRPKTAASSPGMSVIISGMMIPMPVIRVTTWIAHRLLLSRSETENRTHYCLQIIISERDKVASLLTLSPLPDADILTPRQKTLDWSPAWSGSGRVWDCCLTLCHNLPSGVWSIAVTSALPLSSSVIKTLYDLGIGLILGLLILQFSSMIHKYKVITNK